MSEENKTTYYMAAGVFKVDHFSAGFPDLQKIAKEWANDPGFYELIVRKVSEDNYGIQFLYYTVNPENKNPIKDYKKELQNKFGKGLYAWDFNESIDYSNDKNKLILVKSEKLILD
jgi:hypothetical protein